MIRYAFVDADYRKRAEPSEVIAAIQRPGEEALIRLCGPARRAPRCEEQIRAIAQVPACHKH